MQLNEKSKRGRKLKNRYRSKPYSSNLKKSLKVCYWFDRPRECGFLEIDRVQNYGTSGKGEFFYILTATEISTD